MESNDKPWSEDRKCAACGRETFLRCDGLCRNCEPDTGKDATLFRDPLWKQDMPAQQIQTLASSIMGEVENMVEGIGHAPTQRWRILTFATQIERIAAIIQKGGSNSWFVHQDGCTAQRPDDCPEYGCIPPYRPEK